MKTQSRQDAGVSHITELDEVVSHYLETETNFCLLIRGGWGKGKTYYLNQRIIPIIGQTPVLKDQSKTYKPINVSLFGVNSIEEIQTSILLELLPLLKTQNVKISKALAKAILKGLLYFKGMGAMSKLVDDFENIVSSISEDSFDLENLVICFDDLERKGEDLSIGQIIGYINSLVEHRNTKVLLISNDAKFDENDVYHQYKEKIIGNYVDFSLDIEKAYESIVSTKFSGFILYNKFLIENKDVFIDYFFAHSSNLRTLIFCMSYFQRIHSEINLLCDKDEKLESIGVSVKRKLLAFAISVGSEYRENLLNGKKIISSTNTNNLDKTLSYSQLIAMSELKALDFSKEIDLEDKSYEERFRIKYFNSNGYTFYNSVYQHITGGKIVSTEELKNEITKDFKYYFSSKEEFELLTKIAGSDCFKMRDEEYIDALKRVIEYSKNGHYPIHEIFNVYKSVLNYGNPLGVDPDEFLKEMEKVVETIDSSETDFPDMEVALYIPDDAEYKAQKEHLKKIIVKRRENVRKEKIDKEWKDLEVLCYSDFKSFSSIVSKKHIHHPIFSAFDAKRFCSFIENVDPSTRLEMLIFFRETYPRIAPSDKKAQMSFFRQLSEFVLEKSIKLEKKNISGMTFWYLSNVFAKYTDEIKKRT